MTNRIDIGQCTVAPRMKVVVRDEELHLETTYAAPKGKEMVLMLIGLADKGVPTGTIDVEALLARMGLVRAGEDDKGFALQGRRLYDTCVKAGASPGATKGWLDDQLAYAKQWHAALQQIGTRLGLPAGSDVLTDILPAIDLLLKHKQSHLEFSDKMEWARSLAKPKELGMHLADVAKARYDEATAIDRAEFEAYHRKFCEKRGLDPSDIDSEFQRNDEGEYIYAMACDGWEVWCAARGKQP